MDTGKGRLVLDHMALLQDVAFAAVDSVAVGQQTPVAAIVGIETVFGDALDQMVAKGFGTLAVQEIAEGRTGFMTAVRNGNYTTVPADTCVTGRKRVDVDAFYDVDAYRPRVAKVMGMPMFLY